ncbi:uncharacterized protein N7515_001662 [Penicillium bovifimosum]|uniref:Uncharacterized protein n=1 Tax=Penicillium bovifimosum TaxID=126998 RepID=A0A9W9L7B5_9EURO|nr:uncharacterized protein N7515_001662 [Penicillium bovifimosum]KAJ5142875.1 hypothetical protein N7515_001662 [Penicillium bovifimosum]
MDTPETAEFLCDLEGTGVTLDPPPEPPLHLPRQTWVIEKKLSERAQWMTQKDVDEGVGISYAAAKFLCHPKENPTKKAFMRIYLQIPVSGTQYLSAEIRRKRAVKPRPHIELTALKTLKEKGCDVVPDLLAYQDGKQGEDGIVPGGYITYVVWDKVPGESLSPDEFWRLDFEARQAIRDKFREVFPKLTKHGFLPCMGSLSKIIFDKATGNMHLSGFSRAAHSEAIEEWDDKYYKLFHLAEPPKTVDPTKDTRLWTWPKASTGDT